MNRDRYLYLDMLKLFALLCMPCMHVLEIADGLEMLEPAFPMATVQTILGILYLVTPGVFLFSMGCSLALTQNNTPAAYARRGLRLLWVGFALNLLRAGIPYLLMGLLIDASLYVEILNWAVLSDILYFDGLFFLLFAALKKLRCGDRTVLLIAVGMSVLSHFLPAPAFATEAPGNLVGNFVYVDEFSSFPLLSWTIFPVFGYVYQRRRAASADPKRVTLRLGIGSAAVLAVVSGALLATGRMEKRYFLWGEMGFRMDLPATVLTLAVIGMWVCGMCFAAERVRSAGVKRFVSRTAADINRIYCVHWVLVNYGILVWAMLAETGFTRGWPMFATGLVIFAAAAWLARRKFIRRLLP